MISWIVVLSGLYFSWIYTDLSSEFVLYSRILPISVLVFMVATLIKFVLLFGPGGGRGGGSWGDGGDGGSGFGGDGGCGGGDGGGC